MTGTAAQSAIISWISQLTDSKTNLSVSNKKFKFCELCNRAYIEKRENCLLLCGSYENRPRQSTTSARRLQHWFDDHGKNPKGLLQRSRDIQAIDGDPFFAADKQESAPYVRRFERSTVDYGIHQPHRYRSPAVRRSLGVRELRSIPVRARRASLESA